MGLEWLNIDTCPLGYTVMVYGPKDGINLAVNDGEEGFRIFNMWHKKCTPTHWQPLPTPPRIIK